MKKVYQTHKILDNLFNKIKTNLIIETQIHNPNLIDLKHFKLYKIQKFNNNNKLNKTPFQIILFYNLKLIIRKEKMG